MEVHALLDFIQTRMRMAHIYQPVMVLTLLDHRGDADKWLQKPDPQPPSYDVTDNFVRDKRFENTGGNT